MFRQFPIKVYKTEPDNEKYNLSAKKSIKFLLVMLAMTTTTLFLAINNTAVGTTFSDRVIATETITGWDIFTNALIQVESSGNPMAIGPTDDAGILQLTPIYVEDANRIAKTNYTLDDRFDPVKSLEMFEIITSNYNPGRDIRKAIKLHNPGAGDWYGERILENIENEMKKYSVGKILGSRTIIASTVMEDGSIVITTEKTRTGISLVPRNCSTSIAIR